MKSMKARHNDEPVATRVKKSKSAKRFFLILLTVIVSIAVLLFAFLTYTYLFPSDKQLFVLAHYNRLRDELGKNTEEVFSNQTEVSLSIDDGVSESQIQQALNGMSVRADYVQLSKEQNKLDFALNFMGGDFITAERVTNGGVTVFSSPQMTDVPYSGNSVGEILSVLLGAQNVNTDKKLSDGVDRESFLKYCKKYGFKLYFNVPDAVFSSAETNGISTVTLSAKGSRLFSGIVRQIRADDGLKSFLYAQREQIVKNINEMYAPSELLISSMSEAAFEESYSEALDAFLADLAHSDTEVEIVAVIGKHRRVESETLTVSERGVPKLRISYENDIVGAVVYKEDGNVLFRLDQERQTADTVTNTVRQISFDTAKSGVEPKMVTVSMQSTADTKPSNIDIRLPKDYVDVSALDEEARQALAEEVNQRLSGVLTRAALGFFMFG